MLIHREGNEGGAEAEKKTHVGSRYLCHHYPVDKRQTRGVMCTYTCNQAHQGFGVFFCSNALTRYLLVGGLGDMCLSRSLFLSLLLEAARHLRLVLEFCSDARTHQLGPPHSTMIPQPA